MDRAFERGVGVASPDGGAPLAASCCAEGALNSERGEEFLDLLEVFAESPHTFVFNGEKLLKAETDALKKAGAKIEIEKTVKKEYRFDNFGVAEALGKKDKKSLWLALMASWRAGEKPEALPA